MAITLLSYCLMCDLWVRITHTQKLKNLFSGYFFVLFFSFQYYYSNYSMQNSWIWMEKSLFYKDCKKRKPNNISREKSPCVLYWTWKKVQKKIKRENSNSCIIWDTPHMWYSIISRKKSLKHLTTKIYKWKNYNNNQLLNLYI